MLQDERQSLEVKRQLEAHLEESQGLQKSSCEVGVLLRAPSFWSLVFYGFGAAVFFPCLPALN